MRPFSKYTDSELLELSNEQISDAIRLEALERGIDVPLTLPEELHNVGFAGYTEDPSQGTAWVIVSGSSLQTQSVAYLTEDAAKRALEGAVVVYDNSYRGTNYSIREEQPAITRIRLGHHKNNSKLAKLKEFEQDREAFDKLVDECTDKLTAARQTKYDEGVDATRAAEYLRLANGNVEVAQAFWNRLHPNRNCPL
jgi:hypothetical protein